MAGASCATAVGVNAVPSPTVTTAAIASAIELLDSGEGRVAEKTESGWQVNQWLKKAVLLYFSTESNQRIEAGFTNFFDKVPVKFADWSEQNFADAGVRVVPGALARKGTYIARNVILMPSYINIGAYVDSGTMVDTWATVGSCAQIGKNVHLSGGVGIGGVLEPLQANPTIIEDNCFIGARSEIVEGVVVEEGAVISMGVYIGQSTRIYDRETSLPMRDRQRILRSFRWGRETRPPQRRWQHRRCAAGGFVLPPSRRGRNGFRDRLRRAGRRSLRRGVANLLWLCRQSVSGSRPPGRRVVQSRRAEDYVRFVWQKNWQTARRR